MEVARETGETMTLAVIRALEERLERIRGRRTAPHLREIIMTISERCRSLPDQDTRSPEQILGYDRHGIPS